MGTVFEYPGPVTLEKTNPASVTADELGHIDAVLLSHQQHGDNLDNAGRALLAKVPRVLTTPQSAEALGANAEGIEPWASTKVVGAGGFAVTITATPAQHGPDGTRHLTGEVTGFSIDWADRSAVGPLYISGDTVLHAGTDEIVERLAPVGLAVLHLGRVRSPGLGDAQFSLSAENAVEFGTRLQAAHIVPVHRDGWAHFSQPVTEAESVLNASALAARVHWIASAQSQVFEL